MPGPDGQLILPTTAPLTLEALPPSGAFLMDNGRIFVLWLGTGVTREWLADAFGLEPANVPVVRYLLAGTLRSRA
jgi:protein transport protein SEC24